MRKFAVIMPFFALVAGLVGFYLRYTELEEVFDHVTGLPQRGAGLTAALIVLTCALLFVGLVFSVIVKLRYSSPRGYENAFGTKSVAYPLFFAVIGVIWLVVTVIHFLGMNENFQIAEAYFSILSALAAVSMMFFAIEVYRDPSSKLKPPLSLAPSLFVCFWLVLLYRRNASNPVLLSYAYFCLALVSAAVSFYLTSGYVFNKPAPAKTVFFSIAAIFFSGVTLADGHSMPIRIIFALIAVINIVHCSMLIRNLQVK